MEIAIKLFDQSIIMPKYAHNGDAGFDLRSRVDLVLQPGERALVPTGIFLSIPEGYAGFVQPRSGLALKHGISIVNTPGLIDSNYRGEIGVILINLDQSQPFAINKGERIAQLVIQKIENVNFRLVDELDTTERGSGGFGSTG